MTTIKVGGFGFGRKKSLQDAMSDVRSGDTVIFYRSQGVRKDTTIRLTSSVTIDGEGKSIGIEEAVVGFLLDTRADVIFRNMTINLAPKCNFLSITDKASGSVTFENVQFKFHPKMDIRDAYPPVGCSSQNIRVTLEKTVMPYGLFVVPEIELVDSTFGTVAGEMSKLLSNKLTVRGSELSNVLVQSMFMDQEGHVNLRDITSQGRLILADVTGHLDGVSFALLEREGRVVDSERVYEAFFLNPIYKPEQSFIQQLIVRHCGQKDPLHIKGLSFPDLTEAPYDGYALTFEDSQIALEASVIPLYSYKNTLTNSSLSIEKVEDASQWVTEGDVKVSAINSTSELAKHSSSGSNLTALEEIESFLGLKNVKEQLSQLVSVASMNSERKSRGLSTTKGFSMHMIFSGSAGTGKTTMAKLFGRALYENGILPTSKFVVATRKDFVAGYVGQTATKTHDLIESARGGVLFVDEAYALTPQESGNDFATEAVDQLVMDSEEYREEMVIILAGYTNEMTHFIETSNTGLKSRFKNWVEFPDYNEKELVEILKFTLDGQGVIVTRPVMMKLKQSFRRIYEAERERGGKLDGNARYVRNYVQDLIVQKDLRLSAAGSLDDFSDEELMALAPSDIQIVEENYI